MIREPLIRRSTFWADVINLLLGRRIYRVTPKGDNEA